MKYLKYLYYALISCLALIAILLMVSVFPIPGNFKAMTVLSGSMEPTIKTGSIVVVKPLDDYKIGDIITFGPNTKTQTPTTHRINDIKVVDNNVVYITKGDANNAPDTKEITKNDIIGKVLFHVPYVGYAINAAKQPVGFMLIIVIPAVIIIYDEIRKMWKELLKLKNKKKDSEQDQKIKELEKEVEELKENK